MLKYSLKKGISLVGFPHHEPLFYCSDTLYCLAVLLFFNHIVRVNLLIIYLEMWSLN